MAELKTVWNAMYENKQKYIADNSPPVIAQPPLLPAKPPPLPGQAIIALNCFNCQQRIEVNASADGQSFDCPNCGSELIVPGAEAAPLLPTFSSLGGSGTTAQASDTLKKANVKETLATIGLIVAVLAVGVLLLTVFTKARHRHAAEAAAEKQAEAEHQRKVDAVVKRVAGAQRQSDMRAAAAQKAPEQDPGLTQDEKHEARIAALRFTLAMKKAESDKILGTRNKWGKPYTQAERQAHREFALDRILKRSSFTHEEEQIIGQEINKWWP
jgi:hypothetical protein